MKLQLKDALEEMRAQSALYQQSIKESALNGSSSNNNFSEPDTATPEEIAAHIEPQIIKAVRSNLQPMLSNIRQELDEALVSRTNEFYEKMWPMLKTVFDVARNIEGNWKSNTLENL